MLLLRAPAATPPCAVQAYTQGGWACPPAHSTLASLRTTQIHHEFTAPCGLAAVYAHPVEHLLCNLTPLLLGPLLLGSHLLTTWLWLALVGHGHRLQHPPIATTCTNKHHRLRSIPSTATVATTCHIYRQRKGMTTITNTLMSISVYLAFLIGCTIQRTSHQRHAEILLACLPTHFMFCATQ